MLFVFHSGQAEYFDDIFSLLFEINFYFLLLFQLPKNAHEISQMLNMWRRITTQIKKLTTLI